MNGDTLKFNNFLEFSEYLDELGLFHMDLSLDRMEEFVCKWGAKGDLPVIHVVGTNGKGSTSTYLTYIAMESGLKVGTFTSPHFVTPRERVTVDGQMLSEDEWCHLANMVMEIAPDVGLTYFELLTCMALVAFKEHGVDLAVMEAGLGGRFDATNTLDPDLTVFTPIGLDHEKILGATIELIAADKADAMRKSGIAVTSIQTDEVMNVLHLRAEQLGVEFHHAERMNGISDLSPTLSGVHQMQNAHLAVCAWSFFCDNKDLQFNKSQIREGVKKAFIPGRLQIVKADRTYILDGAHNLHAFKALESELKRSKIVLDAIVFSCMKDKNIAPVKDILFELTQGPIITCGIPENERACLPEDFIERFGTKVLTAPSLDEALSLLPSGDGTVLICGSLYLLSAFYTKYPRFLMK
ncbi:folylpolyglutamate synthase/dihydrofolate synthase family protein [Maridesulfovibrio ferrireducens]|uniref:bifunctional folylpolyglutamate synthase/dihydrofolate synthase n=1 Tax=Maridesulfovibrio ferrireducens TaxID=246191 RepID=UPI0026F0F386|nr:folylpolyglutamate synthase/dihydrofolate synthase family protein [Maridesulfovibrio ferrireducens]